MSLRQNVSTRFLDSERKSLWPQSLLMSAIQSNPLRNIGQSMELFNQTRQACYVLCWQIKPYFSLKRSASQHFRQTPVTKTLNVCHLVNAYRWSTGRKNIISRPCLLKIRCSLQTRAGRRNTCWHKSCTYSHVADKHKIWAKSIPA